MLQSTSISNFRFSCAFYISYRDYCTCVLS